MSSNIYKATFYNKNGIYRLIECMSDYKCWRVFKFNPDVSNIENLKEYDEIEYEEIDDYGIRVHKVIGKNKTIDSFFSTE